MPCATCLSTADTCAICCLTPIRPSVQPQASCLSEKGAVEEDSGH